MKSSMSDAMTVFLALLFAGPSSEAPSSGGQAPAVVGPSLRVGDVVEGKVSLRSDVIHSPGLDADDSPSSVRGVRFRFDVETSGPVTIDLRSHFFDAYLVLESGSGVVIAEDDDGLVVSQSRIVVSLDPGAYTVTACSLTGHGPFELSALSGAKAALEGSERRNAETEDARESLRAHESVFGRNHLFVALRLNTLGQRLGDEGRFGEAEPLLLRALEIVESVMGAEDPNTAASLNNLAANYDSQGRLAEAEPLYVRALEICEFSLGPDHHQVVTGLTNLAVNYHKQSRFAEAEPLYLRALKLCESARGEDHPDTAYGLGNLAALYREQGRNGEADSLYLRALEVRESTLGLDHPDTVMSLSNLAVSYYDQGRVAEAESLYLRTLTIRESLLGKGHPDTASSLNNLAVLYESQERYDEAEAFHSRTLKVRESALGREHPTTAVSLSHLGRVRKAQGRFGEAEALYQRALEIHLSALGPLHPKTAHVLNGWAALCESAGRYAEAESHYLGALDGGLSWVLRELVRSTGRRRFSIAGTQREAVDNALSAWMARTESKSALDEVYRRICSWKGVVFRHVNRLSKLVSAEAAEDPELRSLNRDLANFDGQLSVLAYAQRIEDPVAHKEKIRDLRASRDEVQLELLSRLGIEPERESTSGAELSRLLPDRAAVLDFLIHRPWRSQVVQNGEVVRRGGWEDPRLVCFVTHSGGGEPMVLDLGEVASIRSATDAWLDGMTGGRRGIQVVVVGEDHGKVVRELLFEPILAAIPADTTRLFVIPDDFLGQVPFGAIPIGQDRFVLEAVDVVYATDPVTLRDRLEETPRPNGATPSVLAVGGVDFDERSAAPERTSSASDPERAGTRAFSRSWAPLPGTAEEVDGLSTQATRTHSKANAPNILKGVGATEEAVKAQVPGKTILHFATHGFFERDGLVSRWQSALERAHENDEAQGFGALSDSSNPYRGRDVFASDHTLDGEEPGLLAGLVLAGANRNPSDDPNRDDGILTATEVSGLDLSACRLAVLSACQSSLGSTQSGEGLQSLRRGFQEAGAQSVIASLWKVDDEATQQLMHAFYEELWTNERGVGDALRRARLKLLRERRDPYYWGAFTLSGEWR